MHKGGSLFDYEHENKNYIQKLIRKYIDMRDILFRKYGNICMYKFFCICLNYSISVKEYM